MPKPFLKDTAPYAPQNPVVQGGNLPAATSLPLEMLRDWNAPDPAAGAPNGNAAPAVKPLFQLSPPPNDAPPGPGTTK